MTTHRVCPWWIGYLLASPLRRWLQDPAQIAGAYADPGMIILEPGPGMGFFTLELARLAGPTGRVVAVDVQPKMLDVLRRRAARKGLAERIDARVAEAASMGVGDLAGTVDLVWAFAVVHELPDAAGFFGEASAALKQGGKLLLVEPTGHVDVVEFERELRLAAAAGLEVRERPAIRRSRAALLRKW